MRIRIVGRELPGARCGDYDNIHVGVQCGKDPVGLVRGDAQEAIFNINLNLVRKEGVTDFRGPCVHGPLGARFIYLTWGERPHGGTFTMFRRAKLYLSDIDSADLADDATVEAELTLTDAWGMPLCASVHPPRIRWRASSCHGNGTA